MKKIFALLLAVAMSLTLMPMTARAASSVSTAHYAFDAATGTLTIKSNAATEWVGDYGDSHWRRNFNFYPEDIKVVDILNGVTEIGDSAFAYCTELASVTIPNSVTSIGDSAFAECPELTSVTIPNSVTSIGDSAFLGCTALTSVTIPSSVTSISYEAFLHCAALTSVTIPNSVTSIGPFAFTNCTALTSVTIPNSVTSIGDGAFLGCTALTSVTIPNSVTSIDETAFAHCTALTSVDIPNSVASIGHYAFAECTALTSVKIPNSVASIGEGAFYNCSRLAVVLTSASPPTFSVSWANSVAAVWYPAAWGADAVTNYGGRLIPDPIETAGYSFSAATGTLTIKSNAAMVSGMPGVSQYWQNDTNFSRADVIAVNILNGVTEIGNAAFIECTALTSVTIPNSVTSIGDVAFIYCTALTSVTIPNSVTSIGMEAFAACTALTSVEIPNSVTSIGNAAFIECTALTSVTIPNSLTSIGPLAFANCTALTSVTIPNSVTSIGDVAFANCYNLTIVLTSAVPPTFGADWAIGVAAVCYPAAWGAPGSGLNLNYSGDAFATIDAASIGGVTAPKRGAAPVSAITETAQYTGTVTWSPADNPFAGETTYTATIALTPKAGYTLTGVAENFFTVAGAAATNAANSGVITAVFKAPKSVAQRTLTDSATGVTASGNGIRNGAKLTVKTINAQSLPAQIREAIADGELIAGYDISLPGGFRGRVTLSFPVGAAYDGQVVTILHYVNGRVETYTAVVENCVATVTVSRLSPFAILSTGVAVPDNIVTDPPKTGDTANPIGFVMLGLAALCSGYLAMKKRKA